MTYEFVEKECPECNGWGNYSIKNKVYICPVCCGSGIKEVAIRRTCNDLLHRFLLTTREKGGIIPSTTPEGDIQDSPMKISELIALLERAKDKYGNLSVKIPNSMDGDGPVGYYTVLGFTPPFDEDQSINLVTKYDFIYGLDIK